MRASIYAGLLVIVLLGGLGACGATGSDHSDPGVAGGATATSGAGGANHSGGSTTNAGNGGSEQGGAARGGAEQGGSAHGGSSGAAQGGAGGTGGAGGAGGAGLVCEAPRCIKLCEGGDCRCSCEGTGGGGGMGGSGGSSCTSLNTARAQALQAATTCSAELDAQCASVVTVPNQCGCAVVVNSAKPEAIQKAQQAYDAWTGAGCGPYACGANCPKGTAATCQASGAAPGVCTWSL